MTGSVTLPATGASVAVDAVGATVVQIIKIDLGAPGASVPLSPSSPMPVVNALGATASNQVLEIAALTALTTALTPAGVAPVLALDSSVQTAVTALATLHTDAATNHADAQQLHADVGAAQHADLTAILAKQPSAPALESGNLALILAELVLILTKMPVTPALDTSLQQAVTALSALNTAATTNHTDLVQLHADVGAAQHADLTAILAKQPSAPALETGNLASILAELILILTKMPATPALDASVQQAVTALGTLNTAATTNHTDLVQLHGDVGSTLHNDLTAISAKLITAPATAAAQSVQALEAGGNLAAILAELILILAKQPALNADGGAAMHTQNGALDATAQATNTALGLLHTDAGTNHSDMVALHTDSATTLHADLTAVLAKLNATLAVSGSFFQTTQPVSGTAAVGSPPTAAPLSVAGVDASGNKQHLQIVGGRTVVDGSQVTQPVTAAALPLPAGAATSAGQAPINADGGTQVHMMNLPATQAVTGAVTSNVGTTGGLGLDTSLQQIKAAIQATVSLTGVVFFDATVTPPALYVRRETNVSGVLVVSWETIAGAAATPTISNLQAVANTQNIAVQTTTYTATAAGTGYAAGDVLIHTFGTDTQTTPPSLVYAFWLNAGPSVAGAILASAPGAGTFSAVTQAVSATALPLPTGAALEAGNLASILTQITAMLAKIVAAPALDTSVQATNTALGTNHSDMTQLHSDLTTTLTNSVNAVTAKLIAAPATAAGQAGMALEAGGNLAASVAALSTLHSDMTTNHADMTQLHGDVGAAQHTDLLAILAKLITAPATAAAQSVQALEAGGNLAVIAAAVQAATPPGEAHIGAVAGMTYPVTVTLMRPANTTAYAALSDVSDSTSAPTVLTFGNVARINAGSGYIVAGIFKTDQSACVARFRLHLFNAAPTAINDGTAYASLFANNSKSLGYIDFAACSTEGVGSTAATSLNTSLRLPFSCAAGTKSIYGMLESIDAFTPGTNQNFFISLTIEAN